MTDIVEEARALLAQVKDDPYPFDCDEPRDDAKRLLAALADECERLRAENEQHVDFRASINEALPRPFGVTVLGAIAELRAENARLREAMPTDDVRVAIRSYVPGTMKRPNCVWPDKENIVNEWLARLDAAKEVR